MSLLCQYVYVYAMHICIILLQCFGFSVIIDEFSTKVPYLCQFYFYSTFKRNKFERKP